MAESHRRTDLEGETILITAGPTQNRSTPSATFQTDRAAKWATVGRCAIALAHT